MQHMQHGIEIFRTYIEAWYNGSLHKIFFSKKINKTIKEQICSVLAGYVWDMENPFVVRHKQSINNLAKYYEFDSCRLFIGIQLSG